MPPCHMLTLTLTQGFDQSSVLPKGNPRAHTHTHTPLILPLTHIVSHSHTPSLSLIHTYTLTQALRLLGSAGCLAMEESRSRTLDGTQMQEAVLMIGGHWGTGNHNRLWNRRTGVGDLGFIS